jgi:hypothetical protein
MQTELNKCFITLVALAYCAIAKAESSALVSLTLERKVIQADVVLIGEVKERIQSLPSNVVAKTDNSESNEKGLTTVKTTLIVRNWLKGKDLVKECIVRKSNESDRQEEKITISELHGLEKKIHGEGKFHVASLLRVGKTYLICFDALNSKEVRLSSTDGNLLLDVDGQKKLSEAFGYAKELKQELHSMLSEPGNLARLRDSDVVKLRNLAPAVDSQTAYAEMGDPRQAPEKWLEWWKKKRSRLDFEDLSSIGSIGKERDVPLTDRMGEADLIVLAKTNIAKVVEASTMDGKKVFRITLFLKVAEVLLGSGVKAEDTIEITLNQAHPTLVGAELFCGDFKDKQAIWFLLQNQCGNSVFRELYWTAPAQLENWPPYLDAYRNKAREFTKFANLRLNLSIQPAVLVNGLPALAEFIVTNGAENPVDIPPIGSIRLKCSSTSVNEVAFSPLNTIDADSGKNSSPNIVILNLRGLPTVVESTSITKSNSIVAKALIRLVDMSAQGQASVMTCSAQLVDRSGRIILQSAPIQVLVSNPKLSSSDEKAIATVTEHHLWPVMGPHESPLADDVVAVLRTLLKEHDRSLLGPSISCALAFGRSSKIDVKERIVLLENLSRITYLGFSDECKKELEKLVKGVAAHRTVNAESPVKSTGNEENHEVQEGDGRK